MAEPPEELSPYAAAMGWVARITTVALEMVLPGLAGQWVDQRFGTSFCGLLGFAFGVTAGIWHLVAMSREVNKRAPRSNQDKTGHRDTTDRGEDNP